MEVAELEMQRDPQASLTILNNIRHEMPAYSKQVQIEYELLLLQALDKTDHSLANYKTKVDSVLDYFEHKGTDLQRAKAYYYKAGYFRDNNNGLMALDWYQRAWAEISKSELSSASEKGLAAVICSQLAYLLYWSSNYSEALKYAKLEYQHSTTPISKFEGACDLARGYIGIADDNETAVDSIIKYYNLAFDYSKKLDIKGPAYQSNLLSQASFFSDLGMKREAEARLKYVDLENFKKDPTAYYTLGIIYDGIGKSDSAVHYYNKTIQTKDFDKASGAYYRLMEHEYQKGNWKAAADYGRKFKQANDSAMRQADAERVARSLGSLEQTNLASKNEEIQKTADGRKAAVIGLSAALVLSVCCGYGWNRWSGRALRKKLAQERKRGKETKEKLELSEQRNAAETEKSRKAEEENKRLSEELEAYKEEVMQNKPDVDEFRTEINNAIQARSTITTKQLNQLRMILMDEFPKSFLKLKPYFTGNTMYGITLGLSLLNYRNVDISILTGNSKANVGNYRSRIFQTITGKPLTQSSDFAAEVREALTNPETYQNEETDEC